MNTTAFGVRPRNRGFTRGFTLVELMMVLTVLGAMMAFAVPNFREYQRNAALTNTANMLVSSVYRTRSEAMKAGVTVIMAPGTASGPSGTDWTQGWVIFTDRNGNNTYEAPTATDSKDGPLIFVQPGDEIPDGLAVGHSNTQTGYVKFNGAGYPRDNTSGFGGVTFTVKRCDKEGDRYKRRIILSGSGRVKSCRPDVDGANNCPASNSENGLCGVPASDGGGDDG